MRKYYSAGGQRIAVRENGVLSYLLSDHLGSIPVSLDGQNLSGTRSYSAWGETHGSAGTLPTGRGFQGQYAEGELGLLFFNARWVDPYLNHMLSLDSNIPDPYNPLDWNRYAYVRNNPVKYKDPTGHIACWDNNYGSACFKTDKGNNPYGFKDTGSNNIPGDKEFLTEKGWRAKEYYDWARSHPGWWNNNTVGVLTPEQFLGLHGLFEADGHEKDKVYQYVVDGVGYQLFIDNKKQGGNSPYCTNEVCVNGIFNNIAAYSGRHMDERFKTLSQHPSFRPGYGGIGQPSEPFANEATIIGTYIFERKDYYKSGDPLTVPYHWGITGYCSGVPFIVKDITGKLIYQWP